MVDLYTPVFRVEIDGVDKTREIWKYMESLDYSDAEDGESDTVTISVANCPAFAIPARGVALRLWLGWKESGMKYFGSFTVDEVGGDLKAAKMTITAKSADVTGTSTVKDRKDREWENVSLADLAAQIAAKHGCKAKVSVDVYYQYQAQTNESDIAFLRRLSKEAGATLSVKDNTFVIIPYGEALRSTGEIDCAEVSSGRWTLQEREKYSSVKAVWWDKDKATQQSITSGSGEPSYVIKKRFATAAEARTAVNNHIKKLGKAELTMDLTIPGDPAIVTGAEITCKNFSPEVLNGKYLVKSAAQSVSKTGGWTTQATLNKLA